MCLQRDCHGAMSSTTCDIWKMSINDYDFWTQTYDISSRNTENILVILGPREKLKFESCITAFANTWNGPYTISKKVTL